MDKTKASMEVEAQDIQATARIKFRLTLNTTLDQHHL